MGVATRGRHASTGGVVTLVLGVVVPRALAPGLAGEQVRSTDVELAELHDVNSGGGRRRDDALGLLRYGTDVVSARSAG